MAYPLLNFAAKSSRATVQGSMPVRGENTLVFPQLLDTKSAKKIENYMVRGVGNIEKRKGETLYSSTGEGSIITMRGNFSGDYEVVTYGSTIAIYDPTDDTYDALKTDCIGSSFEGERFGAYFMLTNKDDGLFRISQKVTFSKDYYPGVNNIIVVNQPTSFTFIGGSTVLQGAASGATATVRNSYSDHVGTSYWAISVSAISGTFTDGEILTIASGGGAIVGTMRAYDFNPFGYSSSFFFLSSDQLPTGQLITGQTSGATARIYYDSSYASGDPSTSTGYFFVGGVTGRFQNGEKVVGSVRGAATLTSDLTFQLNALSGYAASDAPYAKGLSIINGRIFLYDLSTDSTATRYSTTLAEGDLPGEDFSIGTDATDGGQIGFPNGGTCNSLSYIGNTNVVFQEEGWFAFTIDTIDVGGTLTKIETPIASRTDYNGYRGAIMTPAGLVFASKGGIRRMVSIGQPNIPYSDQVQLLTKPLAKDFFDDVDFSNCDLAYDQVQNYVLVTMAKSETQNNYVLAIRLDPIGQETEASGAISHIIGWNVGRFMNKSGTLYGTSSLTDETMQLFDGDDDVGASIHTEYVQELNFGFPNQNVNLEEFYCWGKLADTSDIRISFDCYDKTGYMTPYERSFQWIKSYASSGEGFGESAFGSAGFGGGTGSDLIGEDFTGARIRLRGNVRMALRFESEDYSQHSINVFSINATIVSSTRRRNLTKL